MGRHLVFGGPGGGIVTLQNHRRHIRENVYVVPIVTFRALVSCSDLAACGDIVLARVCLDGWKGILEGAELDVQRRP